MPTYVLHIKATLEGLAKLEAKPDCTWILTVQSTDQSDTREGVYVSRSEEIPLDGSRGTANFVVKFKGAKQQSTCSVVDVKKLTTGSITAAQSGEFVPVVAFECRGLVPLKWHPSSDFTATTEGGHTFADIDLQDGDWGEYCEEEDIALAVTDLEHKFLAP